MMVARDQIEAMVPHAGAMCLIDAVKAWDDCAIECACTAPQSGHPLARDGKVPAIVAAEYAAQATAVHGALQDGRHQRAGMLAKLSDVELRMQSFPPDAAMLTVCARLVGRMNAGCMYTFDVSADSRIVASGRLLVAFES